MANPIQNNDLASKDVFKNLTDGAKELIKLIDQLTAETKQFGEEAEKVAKGFDFSKSADIAKVNKLLEELTKNTENVTKAQKTRKQTSDALSKEEKQRIQLLEKLNRAQKENGSQSERLKVILSEQRKENKALAREQLQLTGAYAKQSKRLIELRKRYKDLAVQNKENTREGRKLLRNITALDAKLKAVDASVGQNQRNVGNYSSAFKGLGSQLGGFIGVAGGVAGAIAAIGAGIRASIGLFTEFGLAIAKVNAVSGATRQELESLTNLAKNLGESTQFTASQVAGLQLELSKLGFDPSQIEAATESVLNFAIATDSDLARSGEVVAATLNAFQLEASEAGRVADVAAKAFSSSALDIEKFSTAISAVGPAANAVDVSLERTTAILGKIVDSGIDASTAGTALRNVFIELSAQGLTWEEAISKINNSQDSLLEANELFGKRGAVVATVIANNSEAINELDESLQNAEGSAANAAAIIGDTLDGDIKKLQSAIQGAILDGEGFEGVFRKVIQFLTKALPPVINFLGDLFNVITEIGSAISPVVKGVFSLTKGIASLFSTTEDVVDEQKEFVNQLKAEQSVLNSIKRQLSDTNISQEKRRSLIGTLNREYKDYLPNLISEEDSYKDIADAIDIATKALLKRQIVIREEEAISKALDSQVERVQELSKVQEEAQKTADALTKEFIKIAEESGDAESALEQLDGLVEQYNTNLEESGGVSDLFAKTLKDLEGEAVAVSDGVEAASGSIDKFSKEIGNTRLQQAAFNLSNALEELERSNAALTSAQNISGVESIRFEYDKLFELFGLSRDEVKQLADETETLTDAQEDNNDARDESNKLREKELDLINKSLAARLLEIETALGQDIDKVLRNTTLTAQEQQDKITELTENAALERVQAQLIAEQQKYDKIGELEGFETQEQLNRATKIQELLTEIALDGLKDRTEAEAEADEAEELRLEKLAEARENILKSFSETAKITAQLIKDLSDKNIEAIDAEINAINRREDQLKESFEKGSQFATKSLTEIDSERRKLENEREAELRKQAQLELLVAGANVLAQSGSIAQAGSDLVQLKAIIDSLTNGFHDGGYTGDGGEWDTAGVVHKGEHVITKEQTGKYGLRHLSATDFDKAVETGYFTQFANPEYLQYDQLSPAVSTTLDQSQVINRLERVEDAILLTIEKKPEHRQQWDEERKEMIYELRTRTKVERKRRKGFRY